MAAMCMAVGGACRVPGSVSQCGLESNTHAEGPTRQMCGPAREWRTLRSFSHVTTAAWRMNRTVQSKPKVPSSSIFLVARGYGRSASRLSFSQTSRSRVPSVPGVVARPRPPADRSPDERPPSSGAWQEHGNSLAVRAVLGAELGDHLPLLLAREPVVGERNRRKQPDREQRRPVDDTLPEQGQEESRCTEGAARLRTRPRSPGAPPARRDRPPASP